MLKGKLKDLIELGFSFGYSHGFGSCSGYGESDIEKAGAEIINEEDV